MEKTRRYLGSWELGCLVFNACVYKCFTSYPRRFGEISGSAGWLTALAAGLLFLGLLALALRFYAPYARLGLAGLARKKWGRAGDAAVRLLLAGYWLASAVWALRECALVLRAVAYAQSPVWFLAFFLALGAVSAALWGARAVFRLHSLLALPVGLVAAAVALLGLKYADPLYLAPLLGTGPARVFGRGLSTLFLYSDILLIFLVTPQCRPEVRPTKPILTGAALAAAVNTALILVSSMARPGQLEELTAIPLYPLTKAAYFGKFWSRMDVAYLAAFILSGILYLSLAFFLLGQCLQGLRPGPGRGKAAAGALCLLLILCLSGCYDSREVEESAYLIALGVDKGEEGGCRYTFQLSNPLKTGASLDAGEETGPEDSNKTVDNIVVEAPSLPLAMDQLKSRLSKAPELSHLKAVVFSKDLAREGLASHTSLLYQEREVRPGVALCLADSAQDFLTQVKPTLEQSTARYYELLFREGNTPYAPVTDLRSFVIQSADPAQDAVLPLAERDKVAGMGIFHGDALAAEASPQEAAVYKLLSGQARQTAVQAGDSAFGVTAQNRARIRLDLSVQPPQAEVSAALRAELLSGDPEDVPLLAARLEADAAELLQRTAGLSADILGIGRVARLDCLTQADWDALQWDKVFPNISFHVKIRIKTGEDSKNLQNH